MNELMKAFGRLSGEILNATGEATKGFAQGFKESYNPDAFRINPKTKEELSKYNEFRENFTTIPKNTDGVMFFDYPANKNEFLVTWRYGKL